MPLDLHKFAQLYEHLFKIDFTASLPGIRPRLATESDVRTATAKVAPMLPRLYAAAGQSRRGDRAVASAIAFLSEVDTGSAYLTFGVTARPCADVVSQCRQIFSTICFA
jgi:hypothetical protein